MANPCDFWHTSVQVSFVSHPHCLPLKHCLSLSLSLSSYSHTSHSLSCITILLQNIFYKFLSVSLSLPVLAFACHYLWSESKQGRCRYPRPNPSPTGFDATPSFKGYINRSGRRRPPLWRCFKIAFLFQQFWNNSALDLSVTRCCKKKKPSFSNNCPIRSRNSFYFKIDVFHSNLASCQNNWATL